MTNITTLLILFTCLGGCITKVGIPGATMIDALEQCVTHGGTDELLLEYDLVLGVGAQLYCNDGQQFDGVSHE